MGNALTRALAALIATTTLMPAVAGEPQSMSATIAGNAFTSDDDGITLVPIGNSSGSFSLTATTAGGSAYPPPKTRIDRLAIVCSGLSANSPVTLDSATFSRAECDVRFSLGVKPMGGDPDAEYRLDKAHAGNRFVVEAVSAKRYTGRFQFHLVDAKGATYEVVDGRFVAEDRQL